MKFKCSSQIRRNYHPKSSLNKTTITNKTQNRETDGNVGGLVYHEQCNMGDGTSILAELPLPDSAEALRCPE
jgi:hypothetical protein